MSTYTPEGVTDTGFTFTGVLPAVEGSYDVVLRDAGGSELGREAAGITVTAAPLGVIDLVIPDTLVTTNATTLHAQGSGLATVDHVTLTDAVGAASEVAVTGATDTSFPFDFTAAAVGTWTVTAKAGGATGTVVATLADAFSAVAAPTSPVIFGVHPNEVYANSPTQFTVYGWLLDPADCIGLDSENGSTNWSGLDFTNTGIVIPWESTLGKGTWNWHAKQGGSGGTVIASKTAAVVSKPTELVSVVPNTALPGVATTYVITLTGGAFYVGRIVLRDSAGTALPPIDLPVDQSQNTETTVTFTATLPLGVFDAELWFWPLSTSQLLATLTDVITVEDAPLVPTLTSVTPSTALLSGSVSTTFTAVGIDLADTVKVGVEQPDGNMLQPNAENVTDTGFTFVVVLSQPGLNDVIALDTNLEPIARLDDAILATDTPPDPVSTITSVAPSNQFSGISTTYTVTGTTLAGVTKAGRRNNGLTDETWTDIPVTAVTDTSFQFTQAFGAAVLDIAAFADTTKLAQLDGAITVIEPAVFTSISPTTAEATRATTYTVVGEHLTGITAVSLVEQGVAVLPVTPTGLTDTGFTFAFTATSGAQEGVYDLVAQGANGEDLLLDNAVTITPYVNTTPRIDTVSPASTWVNHMALFVVTGYGLLEIANLRIGTSGVGFDDFYESDYTVFTDTRIEFEGAITRIGLHDVIGNETAGAAYLRKDDCLQINSQLAIGRGTRTPAADLEIECGPAAQIVARLNELRVKPDIAEAWGAEDHATIVCEDDSTTDVSWNGTVWVVWIVVIPGQATLTRGETRTAHELGIGRCAVNRAGTALRLNDAHVGADPSSAWGPGGCAYVLCNSGVHDEVRWNGNRWEECV